MKKKTAGRVAAAMAAAMTATTLFGTGIPSADAAEEWIGDSTLESNSTAEPEKDRVLPNENQYNYQKEELAAFCHFGPNTFNEIEWGEKYGDKKPDEIFRLEKDFDADTYVKTLKEAGFKKLIVTAKHHDGFCIWASEFTDYDVSETSYKDGKGDILAEISAACSEYDMDMGLYLSPWDIHDKSYGYYDRDGKPTTAENDALDYNEYYNNQLQEILGNPKYGNKGHFVEVWMDGAKGNGANAQEYNFEQWFETIQKNEGKQAGFKSDCMLFGAEAYTTVRWIGNENGYAAKNTWSKSRVDYEKNTIDSNKSGSYTVGFADGNQWTVPEADARITSGWFWGNAKKTPKSIPDLGAMYFGSVGNNATLLLNVPPNDQGTVDKAILDRVTEFGKNIRDTFRTNLAAEKGASVKADHVRGNDTAFKPGNTVDGNDSTYWTTEDGTSTGRLLIDLGETKTFDVVSVEEAIQNGQRINSYKIEYRNTKGEWNVLDSGETIGAKRLCRTGAVKGDQVRITVSVPEGKVPMISEVGVYKASSGFELAGTAPEGMNVFDISDKEAFTFSGKWTDESGISFIGGTNKWANPGASFQLKFHGTKVYLVGTKDPNHGTAEVSIDGRPVKTIDTGASSRALGQLIFVSDDLEDTDHTLTLKVKNKAIGIESAYVIDNGGRGMIGLESDAYTMNEAERMEAKLIRVGGSKGRAEVLVEPNPGSAIQDDYNTELSSKVVFEDGQTEAAAPVETKRNQNQTGDLEFSIQVTPVTEGLIAGFYDRAVITIRDTESASTGETGQEKTYTEEDPFVFPWKDGSSSTLEAEFGQLHDEKLASDGKWALQISEADWASNGKFVNCLNQKDTVRIPYYAEKAGTYSFTAYYRSGDPGNALEWSEPAGKITGGKVTAGASDNAGNTHSVTFDVTVTEAGAGTLVFTGPDKKSPQLDKIEVAPKEIARAEFTITASAGEHGSITDEGETAVTEGESRTYTITPDEGYRIADVKVNGKSVGAVDTYTFENVSGDASIEAEFMPAAYSGENPFEFPTELNADPVTLEAENMILHNTGENEKWPLQISDGDWASRGRFVNAMNTGDTIVLYYNAAVAGTYEAVLQYRSGDTANSMTWSEADGKIRAGSLDSVENGNNQTDTAVLTWEVETPGRGILTFAAGEKNAPQLDKFDLVLIKADSPIPAADKTALSKAVDIAEKEAAKTDVYTAESIGALQEAINEAKAVLDDPDADQAAVDTQTAALDAAVKALEEKTPEAETFQVTASAGEGGKIDPSGTIEVKKGDTLTFTITPDEGYKVKEVLVNGSDVGPVLEYTLEQAASDSSVEAVFEKTEAAEETQRPQSGGTEKPESGDTQKPEGTDRPDGGSADRDPKNEEQKKPKTDRKSESTVKKAVQTGDSTSAAPWVLGLSAAAAAGSAAVIVRRRKMR